MRGVYVVVGGTQEDLRARAVPARDMCGVCGVCEGEGGERLELC